MAGAVPRLRVALVGAGMIGRAHAHAFRSMREFFQPPPAEVELTVVADSALALADDAVRRYEFGRTATSWEQVAEAQDVDAVVVALPNFQHRAAVEAFLAAGKHVLCEKPLASNLEDARAMVAAARKSGVVNATGFNLRRSPAIAAIGQIVQRGQLGQVRQFSSSYLTDYAHDPRVPFTWRYQRSLAGSGALGDIGSHVIDLSRMLVGDLQTIEGATLATFIAERPVPAGDVTGHGLAATTGEMRTVDTDDVASFTARYRNGVVADFAVSRIATGFRNAPAFRIIGAGGAASFNFERGVEFEYYETGHPDETNGFRVVVGPAHPYLKDVLVLPVAGVGYGYTETYIAQAYEFVRAVAGQVEDYHPNFEDGLATAIVCEAVLPSAEQRRPVDIAEFAE